MVTGNVKLGEEKTSVEITEILKKKLSIDTDEYNGKDILYFYEFNPVTESAVPTIDGQNLYGFGVTSNCEQRFDRYYKDKDYLNVKFIKCLEYKSRFELSKGEKKVKRLVTDLGLNVKYLNKLEVFKGKDTDLEIIYDEMKKHSIRNNIIKYEVNMELEKYRIEKEMEMANNKMYREMFENGKLTFEQFKEIVN
jgi:hypothetical protein